MPNIDVTKQELMLLIEAVAFIGVLPDLHRKLERELELWTKGSVVDLPIPPSLRGAGILQYQEVRPPHPE